MQFKNVDKLTFLVQNQRISKNKVFEPFTLQLLETSYLIGFLDRSNWPHVDLEKIKKKFDRIQLFLVFFKNNGEKKFLIYFVLSANESSKNADRKHDYWKWWFFNRNFQKLKYRYLKNFGHFKHVLIRLLSQSNFRVFLYQFLTSLRMKIVCRYIEIFLNTKIIFKTYKN